MAVRVLNVGTRKYTEVVCIDEPGSGGACHRYEVRAAGLVEETFTFIRFQDGPIKESGVNGCANEDLIAVVIDRLQGFQSGEYACRENALALTKLEEGLMWLRKRTQDREGRGVEGASVV